MLIFLKIQYHIILLPLKIDFVIANSADPDVIIGSEKITISLFPLGMAKSQNLTFRPLAGYGLPPPRGNLVDHIFLKAQCLARILQHVSPLTMAALSCKSLLHTLPYKIFDN